MNETPEKENETPDHDCSQFLTLNYAAREYLKVSKGYPIRQS